MSPQETSANVDPNGTNRSIPAAAVDTHTTRHDIDNSCIPTRIQEGASIRIVFSGASQQSLSAGACRIPELRLEIGQRFGSELVSMMTNIEEKAPGTMHCTAVVCPSYFFVRRSARPVPEPGSTLSCIFMPGRCRSVMLNCSLSLAPFSTLYALRQGSGAQLPRYHRKFEISSLPISNPPERVHRSGQNSLSCVIPPRLSQSPLAACLLHACTPSGSTGAPR